MIGRRGTDVRLTMVEGESGLIYVCENAGVPYTWRPSTKEFIFEDTGARVYGFSAEEPDSLRGPQFGAAWWDEPAHADDPQEVWDNLMFGLRLPGVPGGAKVMLTGTPIPTPFVKERLADPYNRLTTGSTYENLDNLDPTMARTILEKYEGTHKGRQELYGEVLIEVQGSLWTADMIHYASELDGDPQEMDRIVVSVDPAGSTNRKSDETGIIVCGVRGKLGYVLADLTGKWTPDQWAQKAVNAYSQFKADAIVAENNFGGQMVKANI
jgi:phage terminase large subunit-like protein